MKALISKFAETIGINESSCVRLRHKWAVECRECMLRCPTGCINIGNVGGTIDIEWDKCTECGICQHVCKTGVYSLKDCSYEKLYERCREAFHDSDKLEVRCKEAKEETIVSSLGVNCLGIISPELILGFIACGFNEIHFRHPLCSSCKSRCGDTLISSSIRTTKDILGAFEKTEKIILTEGNIPADFTSGLANKINKKKDGEAGKMLSRRELFTFFRRQTQLSLAEAVKVLSDINQKPAKRRIDYISLLPYKRKLLLASLKRFGNYDEAILDTSCNPLMTELKIDKNKCDFCGICYKFCPTGALMGKASPAAADNRAKAGIAFKSSYCVKCDLCLVACYQKAIKYVHKVDMKDFIEGSEKVLVEIDVKSQ